MIKIMMSVTALRVRRVSHSTTLVIQVSAEKSGRSTYIPVPSEATLSTLDLIIIAG